MLDQQVLRPGTRVRIIGNPVEITLRSTTGIVVRPDTYDDYFVVRLDTPAIYHADEGHDEELTEIVEHIDNLDVASDPA